MDISVGSVEESLDTVEEVGSTLWKSDLLGDCAACDAKASAEVDATKRSRGRAATAMSDSLESVIVVAMVDDVGSDRTLTIMVMM